MGRVTGCLTAAVRTGTCTWGSSQLVTSTHAKIAASIVIRGRVISSNRSDSICKFASTDFVDCRTGGYTKSVKIGFSILTKSPGFAFESHRSIDAAPPVVQRQQIIHFSMSLASPYHFNVLHIGVVGPAAALWDSPIDILGWVLDVARLAVNTVLRIDLQPRISAALVPQNFINSGRAVSLFR